MLSEASKPISSLLVEQVNAEHVRRRRCLIKEVESLIYLLRQNLPIRRRTETEGNIHQLLVLRRKDVPDLHLWDEYLSPVAQNEIIKSIGTTVLRNVLQDIRAVKLYAVMADETTDTLMNEQFSLSIRWVDDKLDIHEDPVEFIMAEDTSGEALANHIKDALIRMQLPLQNCRGQAYDGAANMRGRIKGVSTRLQKECPSALYVHCLAHCTNLALQEASRKCKIIRNALDITNQITIFVRNSPKAAGMLRELVKAKVYYRRQFYEVLDMLDTQLEDRFDQPAMETMQRLERVLERAATPQETPVQLPASLRELDNVYCREVILNTA
ncbi:zinc finger MYM-type protein 1-like [Amphibalanus amphitrite]|uniref:zinc finger MYM-type protein 1-like n=1 Tax=Amphibalanus amphitrite TaxID=1232801 RepID=UPI001C8FCE00|nr:zinc finger MYM-type protein 1-like [Amphibalanus amphitrite]